MLQNPEKGIALVVDDEPTNRQMMHMMLTNLGYETYTAENGQIAVDKFQQHHVDLVFMDLMMPVMDGKEATRQIKALSHERFVPVIFLSASNDLDELSKCIAAGGDDFLNKPCHPTVLKSKIRAMERIRDLHNKVHHLYQEVIDLHDVMNADERLAEKIFNQVVLADNIDIPGLEHFQRSPETFSGDVLLSASRPNGDVLLLLGDLTGHGLSAAIGALPMAEVFRTMTLKGHAEEEILKEINSKLYNLLPTDRFVSMALITLFHNKQVATVWNAGLPDIYLLDGNNKIKQTIKSVHPPLGIMRQLMSQTVPEVLMTEVGDRLLAYTDGLTEANNLCHEEYGETRLCETIENAFPGEPMFSQIMDDFDAFREGVVPRDDISILEIPSNTVVEVSHIPLPEPTRNATHVPRNNWRWQMELFAANLGHTDPIPMAMEFLNEMGMPASDTRAIFTIITELYLNALDHGVLKMGSEGRDSSDANVLNKYQIERLQRLQNLTQGSVKLELLGSHVDDLHTLTISITDTGRGFDYLKWLNSATRPANAFSGRGILLLQGLCDKLAYLPPGNQAQATYRWQLNSPYMDDKSSQKYEPLSMADAFDSLTTEPELDPLAWSDDSLVMLDTEPNKASVPSQDSPLTSAISASMTPEAVAPLASHQVDSLAPLEYEVENQVDDQAESIHVTSGTVDKMLFDYDDLAERLMGHAEMIQMILSTFNGEVPTDMAALQTAVHELDLIVIASLAHKIKGASRNVGSEAMASSAEIMEKSAKAFDASPMVEQMALLTSAYAGFLQQVREVHGIEV